MNMQAMMKQVQKLQKEMMQEQEVIGKQIFTETNSLITVEATGKKEIVKVKITAEELSADDIEILEDMILVAVNNVMKKIDEETEKKLGKYTKGLPGMF